MKVHVPEKVNLKDISELSWNKFAQSTTIHGIKYVFDDSSKSKLRKFVKFYVICWRLRVVVPQDNFVHRLIPKIKIYGEIIDVQM